MEEGLKFLRTTIFSPILYRKPLSGPETVYVRSHFTGMRTQISGIRSKSPQNVNIVANFTPKTPKNFQKTLYVGSQFTVIRSKTTGIRSKFSQNDNDFFDPIQENLNLFRKSRSRLRNRVKTRQKKYYTNVTIFSTLDVRLF